MGAPPAGQAWIAEAPPNGSASARRPLPRRHAGPRRRRIIADEPDRLSEGFQLGQTVIVALDLPGKAGLTAPERCTSRRPACASTAIRSRGGRGRLEQRFPDAGFDIRTRDRASPGAERFVSRHGRVPHARRPRRADHRRDRHRRRVASYLEARRASIATLKILGATSGDIARIYALQVGAAALAGRSPGSSPACW
jgi:putative ABC transport system permease protein